MIPKIEIERRLEALRRSLRRENLEAALLTHPVHLFYFTGSFALGHLVVTPREVRFLVFRPLERVKRESSLPAETFRSLRKLPGVLRECGVKRIGLEFSALSHGRFLRYQEVLSDFELRDVSPLLAELRWRKSAYEVECMRRAARNLSEALAEALPEIRPGLTELEALSRIEAALRTRGHPGFVRSFRGNEFSTGLLVSGPEAVEPSFMVAGEGGPGVPGFPSGASLKKLRPGEPVLCDLSGFEAGYYVDQTRMFSLGEPTKEVRELFELSERLMQAAEAALRPGVPAEEVYFAALREAERLGVSRYFMAHGEEGVGFVGHGVGLFIDEDPPLAPGVKTRLAPGMTLALEPKLHVPGTGVIGLEDTFYLSETGREILTIFPRFFQIIPIKS
ncbi:Xaa-Pro peptidase family protein [Thermosulfurimonas sp. F29]|uniref:M24 family metallopeptidase n=1 Tax=Thermosulfurimonas sp. F29 TaxID=2867247 RepID=UPI001C836843|nr:Xaa-Pro peptidase family protein [Thermosulfurimonas sp. F29]MBX6423026.1 Xaa-Pro peptidase family protein [Thermosulfurimonas sp. F29]